VSFFKHQNLLFLNDGSDRDMKCDHKKNQKSYELAVKSYLESHSDFERPVNTLFDNRLTGI
jgi:hypothetical protein